MFRSQGQGRAGKREIKRTGNRKWGRRLFGMIGYGGAGICYFAAAGVKLADPDNLFLFAFFLIMMGFMNDNICSPRQLIANSAGWAALGALLSLIDLRLRSF